MKRRVSINIILIILIFFIITIQSFAGDYKPEISGNYEVGERVYIDIFDVEYLNEDEVEEDIVDTYRYNKLWLRFKQKLNKSDYYYIKVQYNNKDYQEKINYNNLSLDLWTNYKFKINKQLNNKVMLDYRDKNYENEENNTYNQLRLKYQVDYSINEVNDLTLYLQRQWKEYPNNKAKDNIYDKVSLSWDWDISDKLTINSGLKFDWTTFNPISGSTNKDNKKFNVGFKWDL